MRSIQRVRRAGVSLIVLLVATWFVLGNPDYYAQQINRIDPESTQVRLEEPAKSGSALAALETLEIKGRAPKTGYERTLFGSGWSSVGACDMRNLVLARDLENEVVDDACKVLSGILKDPYTGRKIVFARGVDTSKDVQIDHVVALNDAWQKGAQTMTAAKRLAFANDPLELLAVDGSANQEKSNGDAATWLPPNKPFRCQYVARQVAVKQKYGLWVTEAEYNAIQRILLTCPDEPIPVAKKSDEPV